jgi:hypothetical protein
MIGHLNDFQPLMLDGLQQAEVGWRFHQHGIAGFAQRLQRQSDCIHGATSNHHMRGIGRCTGERHAFGNLPAQFRVARWRYELSRVQGMLTQNFTQ